ncbi:MAG: hypothetical protein ACK5UP_15965 [Bacteroidota bacterium]|jgi:hypothetical protein|nr:hypothetical protein [Cytophagales bacterium]
MKKLVDVLLSVLLVIIIIGLDGCGDEPKPDPCVKEKPVSADFLIYESFGLALDGWKNYDTDTVASFGVVFLAVEKNAKYEWKLGSETITTRSFYRDTYPRGKSIDVSLKVTKSPNTKCFPTDDGVDFKERTFYATPDYGCSSLVTGTFRGSDEGDPNNMRDVTFKVCSPNPKPTKDPSLRVTNLVTGCDFFEFAFENIGYQQVGFAGTYGTVCMLGGAAKLDSLSNDKIIVTYFIEESPTSTKVLQKKFIGLRIK